MLRNGAIAGSTYSRVLLIMVALPLALLPIFYPLALSLIAQHLPSQLLVVPFPVLFSTTVHFPLQQQPTHQSRRNLVRASFPALRQMTVMNCALARYAPGPPRRERIPIASQIDPSVKDRWTCKKPRVWRAAGRGVRRPTPR